MTSDKTHSSQYRILWLLLFSIIVVHFLINWHRTLYFQNAPHYNAIEQTIRSQTFETVHRSLEKLKGRTGIKFVAPVPKPGLEPATVPQKMPKPAVAQKRPKPAVLQKEPKPPVPQIDPKPAVPQKGPEPAVPQKEFEPAVPQREPKPPVPQKGPVQPQPGPKPAVQQPAVQQPPVEDRSIRRIRPYLWPTPSEIARPTQLASDGVINEYINKSLSLTYKPDDMKFMDDYKTPCWISDQSRGRIRCLPYLYISGFPKCATSDLWVNLHNHGQIDGSGHDKETHWWARKRFYTPPQKMGTYMDRRTRLLTANRNVIADGSVDNVWFNLLVSSHEKFNGSLSKETAHVLRTYRITVPQIIQKYTPNAKWIVLLRDPVDRLYSEYRYFCSLSNVPSSSSGFHNLVLKAIGKYENCMKRTTDAHFCALSWSGKFISPFMRLDVGMYILYVRDLFQAVPSENVMIIDMGQYQRDTRKVIIEVLKFIGVDYDDKSTAPIWSNPLFNVKVNSVETRHDNPDENMWPETRALLKLFYQPFNNELARYLKDDAYTYRN